MKCEHVNCTKSVSPDARADARFCSTSCRVNAHLTNRRKGIKLLVAATEALERGDKAAWLDLTNRGMALVRKDPKPLSPEVLAVIAE